jgi:hypothetical protein
MSPFKNCRRRLIYRSATRKLRQIRETNAMLAIDHLIDGYGEKIPYIRNSRRQLVLPVRRSQRYIAHLTSLIPGPVELDPAKWSKDPFINAIYTNKKEIEHLLIANKRLKEFFSAPDAPEAVVLLTAKKKVRIVTGIEKDGEIIRRDVLQKAVYFEDHQLIAPSATISACRRAVQRHLLTDLVDQVADQVSELKSRKTELQEQKLRIKIKYGDTLESLPVTGQTAAATPDDLVTAARLYTDTTSKLAETTSLLTSQKANLSRLTRILTHPKSYLSARTKSLKLSRLSIKLKPSSTEEGNAFSIAEFRAGKQKEWVAAWVRVPRAIFLSVIQRQ